MGGGGGMKFRLKGVIVSNGVTEYEMDKYIMEMVSKFNLYPRERFEEY